MKLFCNTNGPISNIHEINEFILRMHAIVNIDDEACEKLYKHVMYEAFGLKEEKVPRDYICKYLLIRYLHMFPEDWLEYVDNMQNLSQNDMLLHYDTYREFYNNVHTELQTGLRLHLPEL